MTGLVRKATLLVVLGLVAATSAIAGVPVPANCTIPTFVDLVACDGTGALPPAARYKATVTVRDIGNFPVINATVSISFCADVKIYQTIPGGTVVCPVFTNTALTDVNGQATVVISGAGWNTNGSSYGTDGLACATWSANGVVIGTSNVATYDENGMIPGGAKLGVEASDLTSLLLDKVGLPYVYRPRSDLNHLGSIDAGDLTYWLQYKVALPAYNSACGTLCP